MSDWRDIPGYSGFYQINLDGEVRSWRCRGKRGSEPHLMTPYTNRGHRSRARFVKLTDTSGRQRDVPVMKLMVDVWLGGPRPGMIPYHRNGDLADNCAHNIAFGTPQQVGRLFGASARRIPVAKIAPGGAVVAVYPSARTAAKANYVSYQTVLDRCNGRVKQPFALLGYTFKFEE